MYKNDLQTIYTSPLTYTLILPSLIPKLVLSQISAQFHLYTVTSKFTSFIIALTPTKELLPHNVE